MARIIHRPKPEELVAPDYNKLLQNAKPAQQAGMQARAEQEEARSRFERALQKAAGKDDQNTHTQSSIRNAANHPGSERSAVSANRVLDKSPVSSAPRERQGPDRNHKQTPLNAKAGQQEQSCSTRPPLKKTAEVNKSHEVDVHQTQENNSLHSVLSSFKPNSVLKAGISDEEESNSEASLQSLACPSPPSLQESLTAGIEVAPTARTGDFSQSETIESMLNHLSLMTARHGPRDWTFEIKNENSSLASVSMAPAANGGWNVAVTAKTEDQSEVQRYLDELEAMLQDTEIASLNVKDQSQENTGS